LLTMTEAHEIRRLYFEEGRSITQISHETGRDRKTIRFYLEKEDWNQVPAKPPPVTDFPKLAKYKAKIDEWLLEDRKARRKQRHTARRVYDRLEENYRGDFNCSYRTVAGYVAMKKKEIYHKPDGYLPLEHPPGEAQVDFGDAAFYENGQFYQGKYLDMSLPYSNHGYLQLFKGENQECLFEGLITIFERTGGVPPRLWFDNARTIVSKVMKGGGRALSADFLRFQEHYRFEANFCNLDAGHEKGNVENKVGYHRRNLLVPVPRFSSLAEYNQELLERCDRDAIRDHYRKEGTIAGLYAADQAAFLPLPPAPLDVSKYLTVKTNGYGRFYLENGLHEYSTSPQYAESRVLVKITANEVTPLDKCYQAIVRHNRLYGDHKQQSMQWLPYLTQLSRKPNALKYTGIYPLLPQSLREYLEKCSWGDRGKVLRMLAALTRENGFEGALQTVDQALRYQVTDVDSLLNLNRRLHDSTPELAPLRPGCGIPELMRLRSDLAVYDAGLEKAGAL
jgi:transposase